MNKNYDLPGGCYYRITFLGFLARAAVSNVW